MIRLDHTDLPPVGYVYQVLSGDLGGYWWETERQVCVPVIVSDRPQAFLKFLGQIEAKGKAVVFCTVINARLEALLKKRGYQEAVVWLQYANQDADCLALRPEKVALAVASGEAQ